MDPVPPSAATFFATQILQITPDQVAATSTAANNAGGNAVRTANCPSRVARSHACSTGTRIRTIHNTQSTNANLLSLGKSPREIQGQLVRQATPKKYEYLIIHVLLRAPRLGVLLVLTSVLRLIIPTPRSCRIRTDRVAVTVYPLFGPPLRADPVPISHSSITAI